MATDAVVSDHYIRRRYAKEYLLTVQGDNSSHPEPHVPTGTRIDHSFTPNGSGAPFHF
jgi:hypothetical protein